nr:calcium-binding protein [Vandammella animalimorsus]
MFDVHGNDTYHLSQGQDQITDLGGHDIYELSFGHLALGGRTLVQDLDGDGSIHYHSRTLKSEDWRATQAGQWQSRDGQLLLQRSGDDLQLRSATPGAQEGVVVFASFFSQQQFLGLQLPEYVPPSTEEPPIDPPQEPQPGSPIVGSEADDTLTGTAARDEIYGLQGNDQIYGLEGDDFLAGYEGNDFLAGGDGRDQLHGDDGDDQLHGGWGEDRIAGGQGQDFIAGGPGDDQLFGDDGEDQLYGDQGSDSLYGGQGHDQLFGSEGDDYLEGGQGEDRLDGGAGRDVLHGGQGSDSLYGGSDGDFYILQAGDGQDRLIEVLDDSAAHDIIELRGLASSDNWQLRRVGQDLHLHYGQGGQDLLIVQDQFAAGAMAIEEIRFSDGVSLSAEQIAQQAIDSAAPGSGSTQGGDTGADSGSGTGSKHGSADQGLTAQPGATARADIAALLAAAQALPKPASAAAADDAWMLEDLQTQAWLPQHGLAQTPWHAQAWNEANSATALQAGAQASSALSSAAQAQQLIAAMAAMAPADALASASFMTAAGYQPGSYQDLTKPLLAAAA